MSLQRIPGVKHYRADPAGLAAVALSGQVQSMAVTAAQRIAVQAAQNGEGEYTGEPATVRGGWQNEPRAGAVAREVKPSARDRKGRVLLTALDAVARTTPPPT